MNRTTRSRAFTLIELLTVIAIIALLIGILAPALGRARDQAKIVKIRANISTITNALEMFKNTEGQYPSSTAGEYSGFDPAKEWEVGGTGQYGQLPGANFLVDAVSGRDFLGFDPRPTTTAAPTYNRWLDTNSRRAAYVEAGAIDSSKPGEELQDAFGGIVSPTGSTFTNPWEVLQKHAPVFKDAFGYPLLYYRANPNATSRSPILPSAYDTNTNVANSPFVYNGCDNRVFTDHNGGGSQFHGISEASTAMNNPADPTTNNFARYMMSFSSSTRVPANPAQFTFLRPVRDKTFLLISAGKDGIYGNLDDVANFDVGSDSR